MAGEVTQKPRWIVAEMPDGYLWAFPVERLASRYLHDGLARQPVEGEEGALFVEGDEDEVERERAANAPEMLLEWASRQPFSRLAEDAFCLPNPATMNPYEAAWASAPKRLLSFHETPYDTERRAPYLALAVGLPEEEAVTYLDALGTPVRIVEREGAGQRQELDFVSRRANLTIEDGRVTRIECY